MKQLWSPWRMEYIRSDKSGECIFCEKPTETNDEGNLILYRGKSCFVIMNRYPYTNGHLMVAPYAHTDTPLNLPPETLTELMVLTNVCLKALSETAHPDGFNIGMNLGASAGAGIKDHIHMHIVPRWTGDTNFMPVLCDTRVVCEALADTYQQLKPLFDHYASDTDV